MKKLIIACSFIVLAIGIHISCNKNKTLEEDFSKVLIIGIDGAEWEILDDLLKNNQVPMFLSLIKGGARGPLGTIEPCLSPAIWTTIATGKLPSEHGILGFDGIPGENMTKLPVSLMRKTKAMWNIISDEGKQVGMVNWWVTWPAEAVNGFIVSDRVTYSRMEATIQKESVSEYDTYPSQLIKEIENFIEKPNDIGVDVVKRFMKLSDNEANKLVSTSNYQMGHFFPEFKFSHQSDLSTLKIGEYFLKENFPDLFGIYFSGVDTVSHLYWHFMEPEHFQNLNISPRDIYKFGSVIRNYYIFMDEAVNRILDSIDDDYSVIIVSDHGFGPTGYLPWSGGHGKITKGAPIAPDGILIMMGKNIRKGVKLKNADVFDILPTCLYLMGLPVAKDLQGKVLNNAISKQFLRKNPAKFIDTYDDKNSIKEKDLSIRDTQREEEILEKLRSLGYIH
ncbi:MAG: alkaline phosphatase family protein [Candidatus Aminicenantes bacterium]|nr:alkaline phosphatase family protein [Candidatus Aminicenantes bacterium]